MGRVRAESKPAARGMAGNHLSEGDGGELLGRKDAKAYDIFWRKNEKKHGVKKSILNIFKHYTAQASVFES